MAAAMIRFDEVLTALEVLEKGPPPPLPGWTIAQTLVHCAQSVEYSLTGFPKPASFLVRKLAGPLVMRRFLAKQAMEHDLRAPIPGAPALGEPVLAVGLARLRAAIASFRASTGALQPHFAYGAVTREQYEALHAMHFADHFTPRAPPLVV
jgi:hypothetical protein